MLDIKLFRETPELIIKSLEKRKDKEKIELVKEVIKKDKEYRELKNKLDSIKHKRNTASQNINKLKKQKKDAKKEIKKASDLAKQIEETEKKADNLKERITYLLMRIPNILHESVPYGKDDSENQEIKKEGKIPKFDFELKTHGEIAEKIDGAEFEKAAEVSGAGFHYLKNDLAKLNIALMQFAVDKLTKKGFSLIIPPLMLRRKPYEGVTDIADFEDVMYKIEDEDLYMIATSEHPIAALYMNETIDEKDLPIKVCGLSPCFRKEIGSRGVDTKGIFRVHQFWKIEQFIFCKPKDSWKYHEELQKNSEELYKELGIPYHVVNICTGDIGIIASKKYDIEAWSPRQNKYFEVGSNSNCTDYQARRLNIKAKTKDNQKYFIHTLNNTAIATSRTMVAILENFQQKDGSVKVPKALQDYMKIKVMK